MFLGSDYLESEAVLGPQILTVTQWAVQKPGDLFFFFFFVLCFFVYFRELGMQMLSVRKPLFIFGNGTRNVFI